MRKIKILLTLDDKDGIMFNHRRQSRDIKVIEDICKKTSGPIYMTEYTAKLFEPFPERIRISESPLEECADGAYAFIEGEHISQYIDEIDEISVYRWNRVYPADKKLDIDISACGYKMYAKYEFAGNSHDKITKGIYRKL